MLQMRFNREFQVNYKGLSAHLLLPSRNSRRMKEDAKEQNKNPR